MSATNGVPLFIASDQEGGFVQVLSGPGFSAIPQALTQGSWSASTLQTSARGWGEQLRAAGVDLDLAPVLDTVPAGEPNPPIGDFNREYGHDPGRVSAAGTAFAVGMAQAGVAATVKHFPGLGRVNTNTDTTSGVTDNVTTFSDAYLAPFQAAIRAGAPFAMVSFAYYQLIDATHPAVFSGTIIGGMLRGELGFKGVVISDDLGAARQVAGWSPGERAVDFINAGGDMVLSVTPSVIPAMVTAVSAEAASNPSFRAKVDAAALRVLTAKQQQGLIGYTELPGDFNGDGRSDLAVWRPSNGTWYIRGQAPVQYGMAGDIPVPGDFNGDGRSDLAVWRPSNGTWYIRVRPRFRTAWRAISRCRAISTVTAGRIWRCGGRPTAPGTSTATVRFPFRSAWRAISRCRAISTVTAGRIWRCGGRPTAPGTSGVRPRFRAAWRAISRCRAISTVTAGSDLAVWRPSDGTWYIHLYGSVPVQVGIAGDIPVPGDFNGDGRSDLAVWRPSNGTWYIHLYGSVPVQVGIAGDVPV